MRKRPLKLCLLYGVFLVFTAPAFPVLGATPVPSVITKWLKNTPSRKRVPPSSRLVLKKKISRFTIVAMSGGDYTSPVTAMNNLASWCGTPSETNPCLMRIMPGIYDLAGGSLIMQPYVDIEGSGEASTIISSAVNSSGVVNGAESAELRFLTVENTAASGTVMAIANLNDQSPTITHVTAIAAGHGDENYAVFNLMSVPTLNYLTATATGADSNVGIYFGAAGSVMNNVNAYAGGGGTESFAVVVAASNVYMKNVTAKASGAATNYGIFNADSSTNAENSTATAYGDSNSYGIFNADASLYISNVTATAGGTGSGYGLYNTNAPCLVHADRSTFEGNTGSVYSDAIAGVLIGGSKIIGPVANRGESTLTCANSYNGDYIALGTNCR